MSHSHRQHTPSHASSLTSSSMPPPELPPRDYGTMLQRAEELKTLYPHLQVIADRLYSISRRQWNDMDGVPTRRGISRTREIIVELERTIRDPSRGAALLDLIKAFKEKSESRLKRQSVDARRLLFFHKLISTIPSSTSPDVKCLKLCLLRLSQAAFQDLGLEDEDETSNGIETIEHHVREIKELVKNANKEAPNSETAKNLLNEANALVTTISETCTYQEMRSLAKTLHNKLIEYGDRRNPATLISEVWLIKEREWNFMKLIKVRDGGQHISWTLKIVKAIRDATQDPRLLIDPFLAGIKTGELATLVETFANECDRLIKQHSKDPRGLVILRSWINHIPASNSGKVECLKLVLGALEQRHYKVLFLKDDYKKSVIDYIIEYLKEIAVSVTQSRNRNLTPAMRRGHLVEAEDAADEIRQLCVS
ncbi:uncharacterized protein JCM6883_000798 [Sporobolomyces salmoneus]|uniref:uncharacterized protein n=1 Tax=Sporobolomyces salmoneus TaxID=183962 RepID=UPI003180388C